MSVTVEWQSVQWSGQSALHLVVGGDTFTLCGVAGLEHADGRPADHPAARDLCVDCCRLALEAAALVEQANSVGQDGEVRTIGGQP